MPKSRIAIFASGNGTNAEAIITYFQGHPAVSVEAVFCNNAKAFVLERAGKHHIHTVIFDRKMLYDSPAVLNLLNELGITHIVLAGFLWLLPTDLVSRYPSRIINIHPARLPKYGGKGMYGMRVHEAVVESGDSETGITIHEVTPAYDEGPVIFTASCEVAPGDSPEAVANRVHHLEHIHYPRVIEKWINNT